MFPLLTYPLALLGMLAVPALVAVYLLHNRFKKRPVSTLMLWIDRRQLSMGGARLQRARVPWLFFLELLILIMLVIAAVDPRWWSAQGAGPVFVVLDDSFSMQALGPDGLSARERGLRQASRRLEQLRASTIRVVLAGAEVRELGEEAGRQLLDGSDLPEWNCREPKADLDAALGFLGQVGAGGVRAIVVTDHMPDEELRPGIRWLSTGQPAANAAIVAARRSEIEGRSRVLLRVANYDVKPRSTILTIESSAEENEPAGVQRRTLSLEAGEVRNLTLEVSPSAVVRAGLSEDALAVDNRVMLLPLPRRRVLVDLEVGDGLLREAVEKAVMATGRAELNRLTGRPADLLITDRALSGAPSASAWTLRIVRPKGARGLLGPFVGDFSHPMLEGLDLQGVLWGAATNAVLSGVPLLTAGNTSLIAVDDREGTAPRIAIQLSLADSNVESTPNWPALFWNLIEWRSEDFPGLEQVNVPVGATVLLRADRSWKQVELEAPDGGAKALPGDRAAVAFKPELAGIHLFRVAGQEFRCVANYESPKESDLRAARVGETGSDLSVETVQHAYISSAVWFLVAAAVGLALHQAAVRRGGGAA